MRGKDFFEEEARRRGAGGWLLLAAWLLIALPGLAFAAWLAAPSAWLTAVDLPQPGRVPVPALVTLPALPGFNAGQPTTPTPAPAAATPIAGDLAWQRWRAPVPPLADDRPLVAVLLTGLGRSTQVTELAIALPGPIGLAFSPYGRPFNGALQAARTAGHEVLVELPMKGEPPVGEAATAADSDALDLGPQALLPVLDAAANLKRLAWLLDGPGPNATLEPLVGAVVIGGGGFLRAEDVAAPVLAELSRRGLLLLLSGPADPAERLAAAAGLTFALIDQASPDAAGSTLALAAAERSALLQGAALVVLPADAGTVARLATWAASLEARGFSLAPPTLVVERRLAR